MNVNQPRSMSSREREIIDRLLEKNFPGRESILEQVNHSLVSVMDENGSLKFHVQTKDKACVEKRVPVEAEFADIDGVTAHLLLHVVDGAIQELEIYKDDSSKVGCLPDPKDLRILLLAPMPSEVKRNMG